LVYVEDYKDITGLEFLRDAGLEIVKYDWLWVLVKLYQNLKNILIGNGS
jgi:hypothetical protein